MVFMAGVEEIEAGVAEMATKMLGGGAGKLSKACVARVLLLKHHQS